MAKDSFAIELLPLEALDFLKERMIEPKLVHEERHDLERSLDGHIGV